jgi:asparagine synthase (glutamine-hydrolysing)
MSGIAGILNVDGRPVSPSLLASLSARLAHRGPDHHGQWINGAAGFACHLLRVTPESAMETQPLVHPSGAMLVFDGRLDNRDEILPLIHDEPGISAQSPDSALILALYRCAGGRFVEQLTGDFALALHDPLQRVLLLARDALGVRPLYYTRIRNSFLFASEIKALLAHPEVMARPNDDMLACYASSVRPADASLTCFQDIYSLMPAHIARVTPDTVAIRQYWDFPATDLRLDSVEAYAEAFRHYFAQSVRRRMRSASPVAVSVSGGLDSSSILCVAETLRRTHDGQAPALIGISYLSPEGSPSDEKTFLSDIERMHGLSIARLPSSAPGSLSGCEESVWHIEAPYLDQQWNTLHRSLQTVQQAGARVMLTGHWGDQVLFSQGYLVDFFRQLRWREIGAHLREFRRWMTDTPPRVFYERFGLDLIKHYVPDSLLPVLRLLRTRHPDWSTAALRRRARRLAFRQPVLGLHLPTAHARSLYDEARSPHHALCLEWDNKVAAMHGLDMAFPFLDRDLLSFLMSIPGEALTCNGVPRGLLREAMRGILPDTIANRTWKADFTHLVNDGMARDFPSLAHYLESGAAAVTQGYLVESKMRAALAQHRGQLNSGTCRAAWTLGDMLGLELWLQIFVAKSGLQPAAPTNALRQVPGDAPRTAGRAGTATVVS